jgi:predicted DNA-binding transcriptional regulator AlpA
MPEQAAMLLAPKQAARILAVSPRTLWRMTFEAADALPHIRLGRLVRYSVRDIERWIAARARTNAGSREDSHSRVQHVCQDSEL